MGQLHIVVGGQYGSEGKGHVAHRLIRDCQIGKRSQVVSVRVGGPNAGHTVYDDNGTRFPLRQLPVGAITPGVTCLIASGSEVDLDVLEHELALLDQHGHQPIVLIHDEATVLTADHREEESSTWLDTDGNQVASTGKGIGAARSDRIWRHAPRIADVEDSGVLRALLETYAPGQGGPVLRTLSDPDSTLLNDIYADPNSVVVIEGTQGYGLGLHAGYYPKTTSGDCRAIDILAQAGISPWFASTLGLRVWVAIRPNPIRIAGDSGPMEGETTWDALGLPPELTTVTQKVRRVGVWDPALVARAVRANGGPSMRVRLALTMADHLVPGIHGMTSTALDLAACDNDTPPWVRLGWKIDELEQSVSEALRELTPEDLPSPQFRGTRVWLVTTGPNTGIWR